MQKRFNKEMNPSSLGIDISVAQRQKEMNRNRLGDELGETNKLFGSELTEDEGSPACPDLSGNLL